VAGEAVVALRAVEHGAEVARELLEDADRGDGGGIGPGRVVGGGLGERGGVFGRPGVAGGGLGGRDEHGRVGRFRGTHDARRHAALDGHERDHRDAGGRAVPVRRHGGVGPAQHGLAALADEHHAAVQVRGRLKRTLDALLRCHRPSSRVLSTLTPRKRADGEPWLTAATCPGWAFPQFIAPPSTHVDGPPRPSSEPQKSVVVAW